jgi:hypothetical protein
MDHIPHQGDHALEGRWVAVTEIRGDVEEFLAMDQFVEGCEGLLWEGCAVDDARDGLLDAGVALLGLCLCEGCEDDKEDCEGREED